MYEPEQFPAIIYRMQDPKTVLLLFASDKIVCTGAKSEEMVYESVTKARAQTRKIHLQGMWKSRSKSNKPMRS